MSLCRRVDVSTLKTMSTISNSLLTFENVRVIWTILQTKRAKAESVLRTFLELTRAREQSTLCMALLHS